MTTITRDPLDRFLAKVEHQGDCWIWTGYRNPAGYGQFMNRSTRQGGRIVLAHRWSYEHHVGPIPTGLTLDHLCRNTSCVNPAHLEPCTVWENTSRGGAISVVNMTKTHCPQGHPLAGGNLVAGLNHRRCRTCKREQARELQALLERARVAAGLTREQYRATYGHRRAVAHEVIRLAEARDRGPVTTNDPRGTA